MTPAISAINLSFELATAHLETLRTEMLIAGVILQNATQNCHGGFGHMCITPVFHHAKVEYVFACDRYKAFNSEYTQVFSSKLKQVIENAN